ncbi:O-antigen ligase family protein [Ensifer sp. IC4062]|nr:O-antigen ligase family protein [Ensifer sp. IC4062]
MRSNSARIRRIGWGFRRWLGDVRVFGKVFCTFAGATVGQASALMARPASARLTGYQSGKRAAPGAGTSPRSLAGAFTSLATREGLPWPARLFLLALLIPWIIDLGPLRMSIDRIVLVMTIVPCLLMWLTGRAGQVRATDLFLVVYCLWCFVSLLVVYGAEAMQPAGILFLETMGAYLLSRVCIRKASHFRGMVLLLFFAVLFLLPFALFEAIAGRNILLETFNSILPARHDYFMKPRWELRRVQSVFDHPILYGVFCSGVFALAHMVLGSTQSWFRRWSRTAIVAAATFCSLSSGPLSALAVQSLLILWNWLFRNIPSRWSILLALLALMYIAVSLVSNQTFFEFYVHYFAFSQDTGWDRLHIWQYGWASIFKHPLFGIGYHEYERPEWMEPSIDMFWLINFVRFGIPAGVLMLLAFGSVILSLALKKGLDDKRETYRAAYLITMAGLFTVGWTVHFWNAPYLLFMFLLGSASWMFDDEAQATSPRDSRRSGERVDHRMIQPRRRYETPIRRGIRPSPKRRFKATLME